MPDDREVAQDRVLPLDQVVRGDRADAAAADGCDPVHFMAVCSGRGGRPVDPRCGPPTAGYRRHMDPVPKPGQVVSAASNVAHKVLYGGLADLRPMPRTLIDEGELREVYHYRPAATARETGDPILLVTPLAAPALCFDLRRAARWSSTSSTPAGRRTSSSTARCHSATAASAWSTGSTT